MAERRRMFDGVRILELGQFVSVPYCAELFAHGGAEVIKIEPIEGDATRTNSEIIPGEGRQYIIKNRGKRGVPIDLSKAEGRRLAVQLALTCDVVLSNMRPGLVESLGLDYDTLAAAKADLIYGEISSYGSSGPEGNKAGLDVTAQAASGLMMSQGAIGAGGPVSHEAFLTDYTSGSLLAFGVASALFHRSLTGEGQKVSTSLFEAGLALQHGNGNVIDAVDSWKREFVDWRRESHPPVAEAFDRRRSALATDRWFWNVYETLDGVVVIAATGRLRRPLMPILGVDDPSITDPGFVMPDDPRELIAGLTRRARETAATLTTDDLIAKLETAGVPCSRVVFLEEALLGEQAAANGFVQSFDHPVVGPITLPAPPVRFSGGGYAGAERSPAYGEDTRAVLATLGVAGQEIEELVASRIVGDPSNSPFIPRRTS